ncbi:hypothetical protein Tco_1035024 [Tanacetum coccineum]
MSKHTQSHIQLVSSDTIRPPHHHATAVVAVADSTTGSTGRTRAEHNQVGYKHPTRNTINSYHVLKDALLAKLLELSGRQLSVHHQSESQESIYPQSRSTLSG